MSKRKIIFNIVFFIVILGLTIYYLIASNIFKSITEIGKVEWWGFLAILFAVFLFISLDSFIIYRNMKSIHSDAKIGYAYGTYFMGNLGSNVTPWKSAHFPMIGYSLAKRGFNAEETLSVMACNQMIYSMVLPPLYSIFLIYAIINQSTLLIGDINVPLYIFCLIGLLLNIVYFTVLMLMMYKQSFQGFILNIEVKLIKLFKKNFNSEEYILNKKKKMEIYRISANRMWANLKYNIPSYMAYVLFMLIRFGLPYLIYMMITKTGFNMNEYMYSFLLCQASDYVTNIVPTPGGMGAAEFSFVTVFQYFMGDSVNLAVILYRFVTFFGLVIIDFIYFTIFLIRGMINKNNHKIEKKENIIVQNE